MATQSVPTLGNFLRLIPLSLEDLPAHPALPPLASSKLKPAIQRNDGSIDTSTSSDHSDHRNTDVDGQMSSRAGSGRPPLSDFLTTILNEAVYFIDKTVPDTFRQKSTKSSPPATARVEVLTRSITPAEVHNSLREQPTVSRERSIPKTIKSGEAWFARRSRHANHSGHESSASWAEFDSGLRVNHCDKERSYTPDLFDSYKVLDWDGETRGLQLGNRYDEVDMRSVSSPSAATQVT